MKSKNKKQPTRPLAVVTGGSCGIGYELAKIFATNGYDLVICSGSEKIAAAKDQLQSTGAEIHAYRVDLATPTGAETLFQKVEMLERPIDAVAINAGVGVGGDFTRDTEIEREVNLINLNVISTVRLAKLVAKKMVHQGKGKILFTSSIAATMPGPYEAVYAASKAFVQSFALAIRNELSDTGVTVTSLMPGATETNFFHRAGMEDTKVGQGQKDDPKKVAQQGFDALMAGSDHVVAGSFKNKVEAVIAKVIPDFISADLHRNLSKPQTAQH
jgi:short-subunit dehydrogenase